MKIVVDSHTHTLASGHAYSTIIENAQASYKQGLKLICTTDHAPLMPGAPHYWFFNNQRILPRFLNDVGIIRGVEANITNEIGELDLPDSSFQHLDWIIGSFHEPVFPPSTETQHTKALLSVIEAGKVDALGHLGNPHYPFNFEEVLSAAKLHNIAIEINNTSLTGKSRKGSKRRCSEIIALGKKMGVYFTTGSDAHFCQEIGTLHLAKELLAYHQVPEDHIITTSTSRFLSFLLLRGKPRIPEFLHLY